MALVACPFCRELFGKDEAERCPHCDILLVPLASLPPSAEALAEEPEASPLDRRFGFFFVGGGRGLGLGLNVLGFVLFLAPWFFLERPDAIGLSGFDLARGNAPWLLGGALGFALNVPLLLSRRTYWELSSVRGIAVTFALMTACEVIVLVAKPPLETSYFRAHLSYGFGLWASLGTSLAAAFACFRLGQGSIERTARESGRARNASPGARPLGARDAGEVDEARPKGALSETIEMESAGEAAGPKGAPPGRTLH